MTCDRCGKAIKLPPALLTLTRPREGTLPLLSESPSYHFELCHDCARALFGWIGGKEAHDSGPVTVPVKRRRIR